MLSKSLRVCINFWYRLQGVIAAYPRIYLSCKILLVFVIFLFISLRGLDPDFGWHLQTGNYFRQHGVVTHDIYTYTAAGHEWFDHEWANDVIVSFLYGWGGYTLVAVLYAALWSGALLLSGLRSRLGVIFIAAMAIIPYAGVRPEAWTALFLVTLLAVVRSSKRWAIWCLPPLFVIWANLHGGFVVGLAVMLYLAVYDRRLKLGIVCILSTLATFINAFGPKLYLEIGRTLFDPSLHSQVNEWGSFSFPAASLFFIIIWLTGAVLFETRTPKRLIRPSNIFLLASISSTRYVPMMVLVVMPELNTYATRLKQALPAKLNKAGKWWGGSLIASALVVAIYCAYLSFWPLSPANRELTYPVAAISSLQAGACKGGNIFNDYDFGGYLIWKLPSTKVYIDGRIPSWKDPNGQKYMTRYYYVLQHPNEYHQEFKKYNIRCSLLRPTSLNIGLIRLLEKNHWHTAVQTPFYILQTAPK